MSARALLPALGVLLASHVAHADAPPRLEPESLAPSTPVALKAMTLDEALTFARAHEPAIRAALAEVVTEEANARVPRAAWQPIVATGAQLYAATDNNTTATYLSSDMIAIPRIGGTLSVSPSAATWNPYASSFVGVSALQELFDFGRIAARTAVADANVIVAKRNADAQKLDVELGVEEAYFGVYAAKGVLKASEDAYDRARTHRELANAGVQSGLRSPIELTRAEATLAQFDIARIRAKGGVAVAQSVLAASIGAPEMTVDVAGAPPLPGELPSLAQAIHAAAERDPVLLAAMARLATQEKTTTEIGSRLRPNLFATGTLSGRAGGAPPTGTGTIPTGAGFLPDVPNWDVGLVLSWTLFDGVTLASRHASRVAEDVKAEEVALYREREVAAVTQGYVKVSVAKDAVPAFQNAVRGALANYAQADARFKAGLGNAVELADAENLRTKAEVDLALGLFAVARARAIFGRAIAEGL